jgi:hypothetical protein
LAGSYLTGYGSTYFLTALDFGLKSDSSSSFAKREDFFSSFLLSFLIGCLVLGLKVKSSSYSSSLKREFFF